MNRSLQLPLSGLAAIAIIVLMASAGGADSMRCGTEIVRVGDPTIEVIQKCGEPDLKELIKTNGLIVEKWTYNCGSTRFMRILTMKGGKVDRIETADYGTSAPRCQ
jgi:hypothetical protein